MFAFLMIRGFRIALTLAASVRSGTLLWLKSKPKLTDRLWGDYTDRNCFIMRICLKSVLLVVLLKSPLSFILEYCILSNTELIEVKGIQIR